MFVRKKLPTFPLRKSLRVALTQCSPPLMTDIASQRDCDIYENAAATPTDDNPTLTANPPLKTENEKIEVGVTTSKALDLDYPDGGLAAWLTVLGGVCITTATFGFVNSYVSMFF